MIALAVSLSALDAEHVELALMSPKGEIVTSR
jgi:hypothetical protein